MNAATGRRRARLAIGALSGAALLVALQGLAGGCSSPDGVEARLGRSAPVHAGALPDKAASVAAWDVVYGVLQHPRCVGCHPAGDAPLQGDSLRPHAQNVQRGPDGNGLYALRCAACHQTTNLAGAHLPPGAPNWHLPAPAMPLVFEHKSSHDLCRQLQDPARNGHKTPEQLFEHLAHDPLVMWGWAPGDGRAPVPLAHEQLVQAMRTWIDGGCGCPDH